MRVAHDLEPRASSGKLVRRQSVFRYSTSASLSAGIARNDFHLVDSEEYFYQLKGDIKVRIREGDRIIDHLVREGETFFIPPNVPHAPVRPPDTLGVVVERRRPPGEHEHVIFYCDNCGALVEDIDFDCGDIVEHFSQAMLDFWNDDARRTCKKCGKKVPQPEPVKPF